MNVSHEPTSKHERGRYRFDTTGVEIEGADDTGVDAQFPWEWRPSKAHTAVLHVDSFDIDECVSLSPSVRQSVSQQVSKRRQTHAMPD